LIHSIYIEYCVTHWKAGIISFPNRTQYFNMLSVSYDIPSEMQKFKWLIGPYD